MTDKKENAPTSKTYADKVIKSKSYAPNTVNSFITQLKHINAAFGKTPLDNIKRRDIKDFLLAKKESGHL
ncbi:MAG: site-specific integrase [Deltaproteobacteria bacterium]|nr:site-specific integrase [Deltaproteobacteria bacterium]